MMFFKKKDNISPFKQIPKGWFVYEMGQSPVHMLWFCHLVEFNSLVNDEKRIKSVWVEECSSPEVALLEAIYKVNKKDITERLVKDE